MPSERLRRIWLAAAAAVALATAAALVVVLTGDPNERDFRTAVTLLAALLCGGAALAGVALLERPGWRTLGGLVVVAALVDFVLFVLGIWNAEPFDGEDSNYLKLVPTALAWSAALLVASSTVLWSGRLRAAALAVAACAAAWAAVATGMVWSETDTDGWVKVLAVLATLTVGGFLLVPLLRRLGPVDS